MVINNTEYHAFCLWRNHPILKQKIIENFNVVADKFFDLSPDKRTKLVRDIYEIFIVDEDERIWSSHPIEILVVKVPLNYGIRTTAGTKDIRFVNIDIFDFKTRIRKELGINFKFLHSTDHVLEANLVFKSFDMPEFLTNITMIDLKNIHGIVWNVNPFNLGTMAFDNTNNYNYIPILDTHHYKYIHGNKGYIDYVKYIDTKHKNYKNYDQLINQFDCDNYNSSNDLIKIIYKRNITVILDGLHRACIMLYKYNNMKMVMVRSEISEFDLYK